MYVPVGRRQGFTIVELLIVIVVIGILAALVSVSFSRAQDRARIAALQSDTRQAAAMVEALKVSNGGSYPSSLSPGDLKLSDGHSFDYSSGGNGYCLTVTSDRAGSYFTASNGVRLPGACPRGHWSYDGSTEDVSIFANHGSTNGSFVTDRKGRGGAALSLSSSNTRHLLTSPIGQAGKMTAAVWHKRDDAAASSSWRTLFGHATANIHHLIVHSTTRNVGIFDGGWRDFGYQVPADGRWHHYAVVYDSDAGRATLYVDGAYQNRITTTLSLATQPIGMIGNWGNGSYWAGPVDDVRIYTKELSPREIGQLYEE